MVPDIILNYIDQLYYDNYAIYTERNKAQNVLKLKVAIFETREELELAQLPLNVIFKVRLNKNFIYILENNKLVLIFYLKKLVKLTNNYKYNSPLILKRKK